MNKLRCLVGLACVGLILGLGTWLAPAEAANPRLQVLNLYAGTVDSAKAGLIQTASVPCRGARWVVFRVSTTDSLLSVVTPDSVASDTIQAVMGAGVLGTATVASPVDTNWVSLNATGVNAAMGVNPPTGNDPVSAGVIRSGEGGATIRLYPTNTSSAALPPLLLPAAVRLRLVLGNRHACAGCTNLGNAAVYHNLTIRAFVYRED